MKRYAPFLLVLAVILLDQLTKLWILNHIPAYDWSQVRVILGEDFLRFIHVRNLGSALSFGQSFPPVVRTIIFKVMLIPVMGYLGYIIFNFEKENAPGYYVWFLAGIMGGGMGNLIDRIFRPDGVVDWIDVNFYGIFGWERFPTFNIADSFIMVSAITLALLIIIGIIGDRKKEKQNG